MPFDPNQKRGGPANPGNWSKYENSDPEGALTMDDVVLVAGKLDDGRTLLGKKMNADTRARVFAAVENPSWETWDAAKSIHITPKQTLWQLTLAHTDYDVRSIPASHDPARALVHPPTREQILTALTKGTLPLTGNQEATLADGTPIRVPSALAEGFRGVTNDGHLVVVDPELNIDGAPEYLIALTRCCNARAKQYDFGALCSSCYHATESALASPFSVTGLVPGTIDR